MASKGFYIGLMFDEAARAHGDAPVHLDQPLQLAPEDGTSLTVQALADHVRRLAAKLHGAGIRRGDRVAIYKTNNFDIALLAGAVQRIGAVPALLSPMLDGPTVNQLLRRMGEPALITDRAKLEAVPLDLTAASKVLLSAGDQLPGTLSLNWYNSAPEPEPVVPEPTEPAFISHTSGTTGLPKLVVQTPDALWQRLRVQKLVAGRTWRRESVALCISFVHARFYSALHMGMSYGKPLLISVSTDTDVVGPMFAAHRPGVIETQPNTFVAWEVLADAEGQPLSNVRYYSATFDAVHPRTVETLLGASKRARPLFFQLYGQTETGPVTGTWITRRSLATMDGRCVGWALPGTIRLRVVDADGNRCKPGQVGYIEVRSRTRAITYLGEDIRFRDQLTDGWWRMGDVGFTDRLRRVHLLDREIDQIDATDSTLELEDELMSALPELREIVIVADADGKALPVVCTRDDVPLDPERWAAATADMPLAAPRQMRFDELPMTATWKIRRPELIRRLQEEGVNA
ncbi:class I adenylate-forming enzyme family protein [Kutzneria buriramensis]|uniref:Long-chain acyl-CoA synthetase n=1 Tax=Kutzneria buriramensis TaxID=1045776 RepID=A0A3E0HED1_9PSEU|nr:class I adenylate-forming enzyme family protein [Kutzneria buriramensis]REH43570.1 long-chain acyl-CoA synthetase [Kutzneria buriramensis]